MTGLIAPSDPVPSDSLSQPEDSTGSRVQSKNDWLAALARWSLPLILLASLAARLWYSALFPLSYDETHNLMIGVLATEGHAPYREIYSVIGPFALLTMWAGAWLFGPNPAVRTLMAFYGLAGIAALYWLVRRQTASHAVWAAPFAAIFYSFNPHYFFVSTSLNLEAGALAFGLFSLALAELYRTRPAARWLFLSGALFGLSATLKIFAPYLPVVIALQTLLILVYGRGMSLRDGRTYRELARLGLIWLAGAATVVVILLAFFDRAALFEQVYGSRLNLREAIETDEQVNIAESLAPADIIQYIPLLAGALVGVVAIWRQRRVYAWVWPLWWALALLFLLSHDPVRPRHTVTLLPPLAALSGIGVAYLGQWLATWRGAGWLNPLLAAGVIAGALLAPLPLVEIEPFVEHHPARQAVISYIQQATAPDDCIISKENRLIFLADRRSTPYLSLISTARLFSGLLPADAIAREAELHDCPVLDYSDTFDTLTPDLRRLAGEVYALRLSMVDPREPDHTIEIYTVQMDSRRPPPQPLDYLIGGQIRLLGFDLNAGPWRPGEAVILSTYWQAQEPVDLDYKLFVHLTDAQGGLAQGYDHYPFPLLPDYLAAETALNPALLAATDGRLPDGYPATGLIPTRLWLPGKTLKESYRLALPAELPPGDYTLRIGLYDEATMQRPSMQNRAGGQEQSDIVLATVRVE